MATAPRVEVNMNRGFVGIRPKQVKELERELNQKIGLQPVYEVSRVHNLHEFQDNVGYESTIHVGNMQFNCNQHKNNNRTHHLEKLSEYVAKRNVYREMYKRNWKISKRNQKPYAKEKLAKSNAHKIEGLKTNKEGLQCILNMGNDQLNVIYECGKFISDEVFAKLFKDLVKHVSTIVPNSYYSYTTRLKQDDHVTGYTSVLDFSGKKYESLGLMVDEVQAEQSASEVCLRKLLYIPTVEKEDYLIRPYRGGLSRQIEGINVNQQYTFTSTVLYDVLEAFLDSRNMQRPTYYTKLAESKLEDLLKVEFSMRGLPERTVDCICAFYGKFFKAPTSHILRIALQLSAKEALDYFGLCHLQERMELRKYIRINRYDFSKASKSLFNNKCPSQCRDWVWPRFVPQENYGDDGVESLLDSKIILNNLPEEEYMRELVKGEMTRAPAFRTESLFEIKDLSVAKIDENNPNLITIGNSHFSIKMLVDDGKIYTKENDTKVEILPGHTIEKLNCEYRVSLPSLEIHLKAIDCNDLYFSNPLTPVVTSCCVVVLFHDYLASPKDVFVLVKRTLSGTSFESKVHLLQGLLQTLIQCDAKVVVTPADCTQDIGCWSYNEVKLLSEMTMDSLCKVMSTCTKFDTRWNELFARGELDGPLKEVQEICLLELKRREDEGLSEEDQNIVWELPQSEFVTRFDSIGIHLEESIFCGMRALAESGIKITLADIESCSKIDVPVEGDKEYKGDVTRYYIWKEANKGGKYDKPNQEITKGYTVARKTKFGHDSTKYNYGFEERKNRFGDFVQREHLMRNVEYLNADGSRTKYGEFLKFKISELEEQKASQVEDTNEPADVEPVDGEPADIDQEGNQPASGEAVNADSSSSELPVITLPGEESFVNYTTSLATYCASKKLKHPVYKQTLVGNANERCFVSGTVAFDSYFYTATKLAFVRKEANVLAAHEALIQLGYLKRDSSQMAKKLTTIHLPGDLKFTSYKSSLQMLSMKERWGEPKYSFKKERGLYRGSVMCKKMVLVTKVLSSSMKESGSRAAYEALCQFGYLGGVLFEAGYMKLPARKVVDKVSIEETKSKDDVDAGSTGAVEEEADETDDGPVETKEDIEMAETEVVDNVAIKETEAEDDVVVGNDDDNAAGVDETEEDETDDGPVETKGDIEMAETEDQTSKQEDDDEEEEEEVDDDDDEPADTEWLPYIPKEDKRKRIKKTRKDPPLPSRDAFRLQFSWMTLDDAMNVCPSLTKVSHTSQFQEQLKKIVDDANNILVAKGLEETVTSSLLLKEEDITEN